jgi:hypothetical protein
MKTSLIFILVIGILTALYVNNRKLTPDITKEAQAITAVKKSYPEYKDYPSDSLSPKRVEVIPDDSGWRVGMYIEGSGVIGILKANCFLVTKTGIVKEAGFFQGEGPARSINLATCTPKD